ncbi:MAG: Txe/YoeB family addiction module toxin [Treponematales bacterium]
MLDITFSPDAFRQYLDWQAEDRKTMKRINLLISDILRNGLMKASANRNH